MRLGIVGHDRARRLARLATWRLPAVVAIGSFLVAGGGFATLGAAWAGDMRAPRVTALGSGKALSVLVTDGDARLLIATGDDPIAFANALGRVRHPMLGRIDVLLVAGRGKSLVVPIAARQRLSPRYVASLGSLPRTPETAALGAPIPVLPTPRRIKLSPAVTLLVATAETPRPDDPATTDVAWSVLIRHQATSVAIISDGADLAKLPPLGPLSALIVAGAHPETALAAATPPAVVVGADVTSGKDLRQLVVPADRHPLWAIRVFSGDAARLDFVAGGLRLPRDLPQPLSTAAMSDAALDPIGKT